MKHRAMRIGSALVLALLILGCSGKESPDNFVRVSSQDAELNAAIARAQETLPGFLERLANPMSDDADFLLKVAMLTKDNGREHIWVKNIERTESGLSGNIANVPVALPGIKIGDRVEFNESDVSDWLISKLDGSMEGGFTVVVLDQRE